MKTDPGDLVIDPLTGGCVTGEVAERHRIEWICTELKQEYLLGAEGHFEVGE